MAEQKARQEIQPEDRMLWSVAEASAYSTIGEKKLRKLAKEPGCVFSVRVGRRICIKRKEFEEYISNVNSI